MGEMFLSPKKNTFFFHLCEEMKKGKFEETLEREVHKTRRAINEENVKGDFTKQQTQMQSLTEKRQGIEMTKIKNTK